MKQFYEHLMTGKSACSSLHQATKWMRESEKFCAVKNWASEFVLIGDDVSSIGGMFYSSFLSRNLISVSRNKLTPMTS